MYLSHVHLFYCLSVWSGDQTCILFENISPARFQATTQTSLYRTLYVFDISVSLKSSLSVFRTTKLLHIYFFLIVIIRGKT